MFVVFEGIDGSGKSIQLDLLARALEHAGIPCTCVDGRQPRPTRVVYRQLIASPDEFPSPLTSLLLGLSDAAYLVDRHRAVMEDPRAVFVAHRYIYSTLCDVTALGLSPELLGWVAGAFPVPDLTVFFATRPEEALRRKGEVSLAEAGGPEFASRHTSRHAAFLDFQGRVFYAYTALFDGVARGRVLRVNGEEAPDHIHQEVLRALLPVVSRAASRDPLSVAT